jgi:hypothetical protein
MWRRSGPPTMVFSLRTLTPCVMNNLAQRTQILTLLFQTVAQVAYIDHFLRGAGPFNDAEELFKKFLRMSSSVELWKHYLSYVK